MTMTLKAVIFGSIGSFSETSRIQLESFNEALSQNGLKQQWDEKEYIEFLKIQGGLNRLKQVFPESSPQVLEKIHSDKTRLFQQKLAEGESFLRTGFEAFCEMLLQNNILIGLASTTFLDSIDAILKSLNTISRENFAFIGHQGLTQRQKPDPEIYEIALREMGVKKDEVLAFEDTRLSLMSPIHAGIKTIAIPGELSNGQDFSEATLVIQQYSDLDLERLNEILLS
ncbi:MAG: haloacid dehalogenase [Deltaproteobacteria bacterium]|nr:MAG: haloacid dehalogenase [Deltaproteobacteria bacterium]